MLDRATMFGLIQGPRVDLKKMRMIRSTRTRSPKRGILQNRQNRVVVKVSVRDGKLVINGTKLAQAA